MASLIRYTTFFIFMSFLLFSISFTSSTEKLSEELVESETTMHVEKTTHLHFFYQQVFGGGNFTAVVIATKPKDFRTTVVIDDPLTQGPDRDSKIIGRAQGMYTNAAHNDYALVMTVTFVFTEGMYNGSSISMFGRNRIMDSVREMPIVGGSGVFRFGRGYALAKTVGNFTQSTVTVEYNVFVKHY